MTTSSESAAAFRDLSDRIRFPLDERRERLRGDPRVVSDYLARTRSEALRVGPTTAPKLWRVVERTCEALRIDSDPEVYVRPDATLNASALVISPPERPIVVLHSSLVTLLDPAELGFILGHEFGHVGLGHAHRSASSATSELDALVERSQQRYAELSADRAGMMAVQSIRIAASAIIKSGSGLPRELLGFDTDAFIAQMERVDGEGSRAWELQLSHPSMPFRLWALLRFAHSSTYLDLVGVGGGTPAETIDDEIRARLDAMGDGRLSRMERRALDVAIMWFGTALIMLDGRIDEHERTALTSLIGDERATPALEFAAAQGLPAVRAKLHEAMRDLGAASAASRARFSAATKDLVEALAIDDPAAAIAEALGEITGTDEASPES
jgi:predicted Zn-dependent protease